MTEPGLGCVQVDLGQAASSRPRACLCVCCTNPMFMHEVTKALL